MRIIHLTGPISGTGNVSSVTINCAHISATINNQPTDIRGCRNLGPDWYDKDHAEFMRLNHALQKVLARMLIKAGARD